MVEYSAYVGLDVHKDTISVAVALPGREDPVFRGEIRNQRSSLRRLIGRLSPDGEVISFCYEAGPCGYGVSRDCGNGSSLRGGGTEPDPAACRRPGEDGPARCGEAGRPVPCWNADIGVTL